MCEGFFFSVCKCLVRFVWSEIRAVEGEVFFVVETF